MNPRWAQTLSRLAVSEPPLRYYLAATSPSPACIERRPHTRSSSSDRAQLRLVSFPAGRGIQDASVLEIGVGVGEIQLELPYRGARQHPP
jgi:hypothetical protein